MAITIDLPQVGESVIEGIIGKWLKQPGDKLERYDPLVEVVTDKVTMEVPSPVNGVLSRILAEEGETVPMGAPIAEIETEEAGPPSVSHTGPPSQAQVAREKAPESVGTIGYLLKDVKPVGPTGGGVEEPETSQETTTVRGPSEERTRHSPAVRRLAREHNVDLTMVTGTGMGGRITRGDVLSYIEAGMGGTVLDFPPKMGRTPEQKESEDQTIALSPVRRIIAQHMMKSATEIPHAWSMVEVDADGLVKYRDAIKSEFQQREGVALTYLSFVIKAVVESLKQHPMLNSTWGGDKITLKKRIHVGIAVAAPEGLVVPVIHNADSSSISGLARIVHDLTAKARQGRLSLQEVQGGTFTVNNTGALGSIVSQPIINHPQAAILTTEAKQKRPVVLNDAIAIRSMMNICLSFDHRIVDGAESGAFLQSVKARLEAMGPDTSVY
ncbi:MAG: 2-oxo acid dehydrogenase subunit E2 [Dehalococcoidia bacterium]|nr:2-oxo acid dehydrogenase subunit E2 [Dehalococcoidia bacterium]